MEENQVQETVAPEPSMPNPEANQPEQKPIGMLFDSINYARPEDIPIWIERMGVQDAIFALISASAYGYKKGIYNLLESEIVSKAIRIITVPKPQPNMPQGSVPPPPPPPPARIIKEGEEPVPAPIVASAVVEGEK
jgi:hypothetical protein